jgi:hypothetical protein
VRLVAPRDPPAGEQVDAAILDGSSHYEVTRGGDHWNVYWGDLHRHSSISRCMHGLEPSPTDRWVTGRDVHLYDFMALTDHTTQFDPFTWWQLDKQCWLHESDGYCTLAGWEWSTVKYGHHNVILPGRISKLVASKEPIETLYERLGSDAFVTIPHHSSDFHFPNLFSACDDRYTRLIEVYQAKRGNFEFDGCFKQAWTASAAGCFVQDALNAGHKFGIIASTDHGFGCSYACVLAKKLDRQDVFDALFHRRTYGATRKGMLVDLRVGDAVMGEETEVDGVPHVKFTARGTTELADVVLFRNGAVFASARRGAAPANEVTPVVLTLDLDHVEKLASRTWSIHVVAPKAELVPLEERKPRSKLPLPYWSIRGDEAVFDVAAGCTVDDAHRRFVLDVHPTVRRDFTIRTPSGERTVSAADLATTPIEGVAPDGTTFRLGATLGDGVVDLAHGLGSRDFTGEWDDPAAPVGPSWYYGRIVQTDGEIAWSSPIFVDRKK